MFFDAADPAFNRFTLGNAPVQKLAGGFAWVEGPVWFGDANCLLFSDIPSNRIMRWTPGLGISTYREPSDFSNGLTRDRQGRLLSCQHGTRSVTRTEYDGSITVLADRYMGKRLNSPNDIVVKSDGTIWFTDPHYGIMTDYEGHRAEQELPCHVYRFDPRDGSLVAVVSDMACPNGLAFSPEEDMFYVSDTGRMFEQDPTHIRRFRVGSGNTLSGGEVFHAVGAGVADGFRLDTDGNLWSSAADGVHCINPAGQLLGRILVPETVSNLCFGGRGGHRLFMTGTTGLYSIALNRSGA